MTGAKLPDAQRRDAAALGVQYVQIAPAPSFSCGVDRPSLATLYFSHYARLLAVVAAARTGNDLLIKLALEDHDRHGFADFPDSNPPKAAA